MKDDILETENGTYVKLDEKYEGTIELIDRMSRLVPYNKDKVTYLETLISYVDALINGDDIHQYTTFEYETKYAKEALREITDETHAKALKTYRQEKEQLNDDVEELRTKKSTLGSQVQSLEDQKTNLVNETSSLSIELEKIKSELDDLKRNGIARVNEEVDVESKRLSDEISSLNEQKNTLTSSIETLKKTISDYNKAIDALSKNNSEIEWVPIDENSPVYTLSKYTIRDYIYNLILEYSKMANENYNNAKQAIRYNCQGLYSILTILQKHEFVYQPFNGENINTIINIYSWSSKSDENAANSIREALKTIKLPVLRKKVSNIDNYSLNPQTIPTNVNSMLRELHLQRELAEAIAKQKILERELEIVVSILKSIAPSDYDLKPCLQAINDLDKLVEPSEPTLKLQ